MTDGFPKFTQSLRAIGLAFCLAVWAGGEKRAFSDGPTPPKIAGRLAQAEASKPAAEIPRLPMQSPGDSANSGARPNDLLREAVAELAGRTSIAAKVRLRINILGQEIVGSGTYLQGSRESRWLRYSVRLQVDEGGDALALEQVCDGRSFWTRRDRPLALPSVTRIDLLKVERFVLQRRREKQGEAGQDEELGGPASPPLPAALMNLGGLRQLLGGLESAFDWSRFEERRLGDVPVLAIHGVWKRDYLERLLPPKKEALAAGWEPGPNDLPDGVPDQAVVFLGEEDRFPYRIEYLRRRAVLPQNRQAAPAIDAPLLVLEFYDVRFEARLESRQFAFDPSDLDVTDQTEAFLKALPPP